MNFVRDLGFFGLLYVVGAWDGKDVTSLQAGAPTEKKKGLRRNDGDLSPRLKGLLNNSLYAKNYDNDEPAPLHLRQPKLPAPASDLPEVLRRIRCCNAYASYYSLGVYHRDAEIIDGIAYGQCDERQVAIRVGDPIQLQVDDQTQVTFLDSNEIETSDLLLLVAYRSLKSRDQRLHFRSHIYKHGESDETSGDSASVVMMNFFDGGMFFKGVNLEIADHDKAKTHRSEVLSTMDRDHEVLVHPGKYTLFLTHGSQRIKEEFVARKHGMYTVLRIGSTLSEHMDTTSGPDFPERIVVFPNDKDTDLEKSASCTMHISLLINAFLLVSSFTWQ